MIEDYPILNCMNCGEVIKGNFVKANGDYYCSEQCAIIDGAYSQDEAELSKAVNAK